MNLKTLHSVHFLGIGGIGMSALARWFNHIGVKVTGYDKTPSELTATLQKEGMEIQFDDNVETIPSDLLSDKGNSLVIWTPAIPKESKQYSYLKTSGIAMKKRAEVLGMISREFKTIAVAGTHGKTTTSSMIAHLLKAGGINIAAFLGGLTQNYQSNLILQDESEEAATVVVEADEFDRSFLHLDPTTAVVTSADADHLDIYGDDRQMMDGFRAFIHKIILGGNLFIHHKTYSKLHLDDLKLDLNIIKYGIEGGDLRAQNVIARPGAFHFDYVDNLNNIQDLTLSMPGYHNVENAIPAIAIALAYGITTDDVKAGLASYSGVKRRFEIWIDEPEKVYIDDYAHHPEEIKAFLLSVKAMYPNKKITAVFQPHLYTRTRDFAKGFSKSLSLADSVVLLDIYPARELPIEGVSAAMLLGDITSKSKSLQQKENLLEYLEANRPEVLVTLGAGDIDRLVNPIVNWMNQDEI